MSKELTEAAEAYFMSDTNPNRACFAKWTIADFIAGALWAEKHSPRVLALVEIISSFGNDATDVFEQMLKGKWVDECQHEVHLNDKMLNLKATVLCAIEALAAWREE